MARSVTGNRGAFLDTIGMSEGTRQIPGSDDGYMTIVGSTPEHPILMQSYINHPHILEHLRMNLASTAAGRYQLLAKYYDVYKAQLKLPDFGPSSQDAIALQQIKECRALDDIDAGRLQSAITKCSHIWASLPGAGYGQRENYLDDLKKWYVDAGGILA